MATWMRSPTQTMTEDSTMGTTTRPTGERSRRGTKTTENSTPASRGRPRVRASADRDADDSHEKQYDLLTAALLGAAIGAGTTLLLRRGPSGKRPISPAWRIARDGARAGARMAGRGARVAWERGADAWERVPREQIQSRMHEYFDSARDAIDHVVESELNDLRKAIRRRRRKLGL